jgi:hypothetical protein
MFLGGKAGSTVITIKSKKSGMVIKEFTFVVTEPYVAHWVNYVENMSFLINDGMRLKKSYTNLDDEPIIDIQTNTDADLFELSSSNTAMISKPWYVKNGAYAMRIMTDFRAKPVGAKTQITVKYKNSGVIAKKFDIELY